MEPIIYPDLELATDPQLKLIAKLVKTREVNKALVIDMRNMWRRNLLTVAVASQFITLLTNCPVREDVVDEEPDLTGLHYYKGRMFWVARSKNGLNYSSLLLFKKGKLVGKEYYPSVMENLSAKTLIAKSLKEVTHPNA